MKICTKESKYTLPTLIYGHLYKEDKDSNIYIYSAVEYLVNLATGNIFAYNGGFGRDDGRKWEDVTDKFCLSEI